MGTRGTLLTRHLTANAEEGGTLPANRNLSVEIVDEAGQIEVLKDVISPPIEFTL